MTATQLTKLQNLDTDPTCQLKRSGRTSQGDIEITGTGPYRYEYAGSQAGVLKVWENYSGLDTAPVGTVLFMRIYSASKDTILSTNVRNTKLLLNNLTDQWAAWQVTTVGEHVIDLGLGALVLSRTGVFTADTWTQLRAMYEQGTLESPYFDFTTLPLQ